MKEPEKRVERSLRRVLASATLAVLFGEWGLKAFKGPGVLGRIVR